MARAPLSQQLLAWYDRAGRDLPWRYKGDAQADGYRVWLSEIMLQQTTVATVGPYYEKFLKRWPRLDDLAQAPLDDVLSAWAGLGYYARARNLHACARRVVADHGGIFPAGEKALKALPGIGDYSAAAIRAAVYNKPANVVDGNVERVISRLYRVQAPLPKAKREIRDLAAPLVPRKRARDYAQAIIDLGANVCKPRNPRCDACPWRGACAAHAKGDMESFPKKTPKKAVPTRRALAFWVEADGAVLMRRRPEKGLLGGMMEVPSSPWAEAEVSLDDPTLLALAPLQARWRALPDPVVHVFTHFRLELTVLTVRLPTRANLDGEWVPVDTLGERAVPTLFMKIAKAVLV